MAKGPSELAYILKSKLHTSYADVRQKQTHTTPIRT